MKTTKLYTAILLVAVATTLYGQFPGSKEGSFLEGIRDRLFPDRNQAVEYTTVDYYDHAPGRIESWMTDLHSWANSLVSKDTYEAPAIYMTIMVENAEVVYESGVAVEGWMGNPFEAALPEDDLNVEYWMSAPFEASLPEDDLYVEYWMSAPFEASLPEDDLYVENWMGAPFEAALAQEELPVEGWMKTPFGTSEDEVAVEDWMTVAWN